MFVNYFTIPEVGFWLTVFGLGHRSFKSAGVWLRIIVSWCRPSLAETWADNTTAAGRSADRAEHSTTARRADVGVFIERVGMRIFRLEG
jgi:hypothetical protein